MNGPNFNFELFKETTCEVVNLFIIYFSSESITTNEEIENVLLNKEIGQTVITDLYIHQVRYIHVHDSYYGPSWSSSYGSLIYNYLCI